MIVHDIDDAASLFRTCSAQRLYWGVKSHAIMINSSPTHWALPGGCVVRVSCMSNRDKLMARGADSQKRRGPNANLKAQPTAADKTCPPADMHLLVALGYMRCRLKSEGAHSGSESM